MIKNGEKYVNGNIKFKIKVIKVKEPPIPVKVNQGIYAQMSNNSNNRLQYNKASFNLSALEQALKDLYNK